MVGGKLFCNFIEEVCTTPPCLLNEFEIVELWYMVGVAQLVRAEDCGSSGRGFKSRHSPQPSVI